MKGQVPRSGKNPRFNADNLMSEINLVTDLSQIDRLICRFILIPLTKTRLLEREGLVEAPLDGYNPPFLDGIWLRAPYLYNGSVPSLYDLLTPPEKRPQVFWRGYDVYDPGQVGFMSQSDEAKRVGTKYDTRARAASNRGHTLGTDLPEQKKETLIEYLKTL
jgi:hypothetical protein